MKMRRSHNDKKKKFDIRILKSFIINYANYIEKSLLMLWMVIREYFSSEFGNAFSSYVSPVLEERWYNLTDCEDVSQRIERI